METELASPRSFLEAVRYFTDPAVALNFMVELRWPNGVICPRCGSRKVTFLANARLWKCRTKHPQQKFSIKVGTILEDSPIGLDKWLPAIWLLGGAKNGISSHELGRALKVTQKTAWFMLQRIRLAMQRGTFDKLSGEIEADESFIGGKARYMHAHKRAEKIKGTGPMGKAIVMGLLERQTGKVRVTHIQDRKRKTLHQHVRDNVEPGSDLFTDELASYSGLEEEYVHQFVNHAESYVRGNVHTNGMENFWSLLKRAIKGTYTQVEPFHLFRYLDEQAFRYNERKHEDGDAGRFMEVLRTIVGKRLTYKELIGDETTVAVPA